MATAGSNEFKLIGPHDEEDLLLSALTLFCHLSPEISAIAMEIRWFKETDCVCLYKSGQVTEGRGYEGRVSLFTQELERGNVSLRLRDCTESDKGQYLCQVSSGDTAAECTVGVFGPFSDTPESSGEEAGSPQGHSVLISQTERVWTGHERLRMMESALLAEFSGQNRLLKDKENLLMERNAALAETLQLKDKALEEKDTLLTQVQNELRQTTQALEEDRKEMSERFANVTKQLQEKNEQLENMSKLLGEKETLLEGTVKEVDSCKEQLETVGGELQDKSSKLQEALSLLEQRQTELTEKEKQLEEKERLLSLPGRQSTDLELPDLGGEAPTAPVRRKNSLTGLPPIMSGETPAAPLRRTNSLTGLPPIMGGESTAAASPESVPVELRLVLLGRTGCGKSAAGNIILGKEKSSPAGATTVRQRSESRQGEVFGRHVTVVDTPDWFHPGLPLQNLRQDVQHCVHLSAPGPHAFLLVIPVKQSTGEEGGMLEKVEEIFAERCWRNTMILFTVTDDLEEKNIEGLVQSGTQEVQRLVEKCGNRFHCLNIKENGDGSQITELLEKIEKMVEGNREKFYSSEVYLETESQIRALETKITNEREERRMREEREVREKLEKEVQNSLRKIEGAIQEHEGDIRQLNVRTTELEKNMKGVRDEEKKKQLEMEIQGQVERRTEMEEKVKRLKEKRERERRETEERHRQEMEAIRVMYEGDAREEAERNLMKIIMPELQRNMLVSKLKMQEEFSRHMEEKDRELGTLKQKFSELTKTHSVLEEVYESTVKSKGTAAEAAEGGSKGFPQILKGFFNK